MRKGRGHVVDFEVEGIYAGLLAGGLLLMCELLLAAGLGRSVLLPMVYAASIVMADHAFRMPLVVVVPVGLFIHFAICTLSGFVFGWMATEERVRARHNRVLQSLLGAMIGVVVWAIGFLVLAPRFYPWIAEAAPLVQLVLHVVAFGIPMGLIFAELDARRAGSTRSLAP